MGTSRPSGLHVSAMARSHHARFTPERIGVAGGSSFCDGGKRQAKWTSAAFTLAMFDEIGNEDEDAATEPCRGVDWVSGTVAAISVASACHGRQSATEIVFLSVLPQHRQGGELPDQESG